MIETSYFQWLCEMVHADSMEKSYYILCNILFHCPFVAKNPRDINRQIDGTQLRQDYIAEIEMLYNTEIDNASIFIENICSVFEMVIALAKRMNDELMTENTKEDKTYKYFWEIIDNLGLTDCDDSRIDNGNAYPKISTCLENLNNRKYKKDGSGGMFPLKCPEKDQRKVEIWYQMQAYINEKYKIVEE